MGTGGGVAEAEEAKIKATAQPRAETHALKQPNVLLFIGRQHNGSGILR
jgi:hypothetical protein